MSKAPAGRLSIEIVAEIARKERDTTGDLPFVKQYFVGVPSPVFFRGAKRTAP